MAQIRTSWFDASRPVVAMVISILAIGCGGTVPSERGISEATFAGTWPFTRLEGTIACRRPGKSVTFTVDGRTYAINDAAKRSAEEYGWLDVKYINRSKSLKETMKYAEHITNQDRRFIFARVIDCEDRFEKARGAREQCLSELAETMKVSAEEVSLIRAEGFFVGWPPLNAIRESLEEIIAEGLKLCK